MRLINCHMCLKNQTKRLLDSTRGVPKMTPVRRTATAAQSPPHLSLKGLSVVFISLGNKQNSMAFSGPLSGHSQI